MVGVVLRDIRELHMEAEYGEIDSLKGERAERKEKGFAMTIPR